MKKYLLTGVSILFICIISITIFEFSPNDDKRVPASTSDIPVLSGFLDTGELLADAIFGGVSAGYSGVRNVSLITVGGVALDTYLLTLPLDLKLKTRLIARLANYSYASRLATFIMGVKEQYNISDKVIKFDSYIKAIYGKDDIPGSVHSLFSWEKPEEATGEESGDKFLDRKMIARLVMIYDAIFGEASYIKDEELPSRYAPLTNSPEDLAIINKVQPIIIEILQKVVAEMDDGDMKDMLNHAINDNDPSRQNIINNKAQAVTITLIDFVRSSVLKNYRSFIIAKQREAALTDWMIKSFKDSPEKVIGYMKYLNEGRKFAVQVVVDGLQGHLLEALIGKNKKLLTQIYKDHQNSDKMNSKTVPTKSPKDPMHIDFLTYLQNNNTIFQDDGYLPYFKKMYRDNNNSIVDFGVSTTPTISVRNLPIAKTGANVAGNGGTQIPNFHYVDREKDRAYYFYGNDAVLFDDITAKGSMLTMFERLQNLKTLNCNAQYDWDAHVSFDALINLGVGEGTRDFGESLCVSELKRRVVVEKELQTKRKDLIKEIKDYLEISKYRVWSRYAKKKLIINKIKKIAALEDAGMPEYMLAYIPWPDHFAHFRGPFSDEILSPTGELNRLDYWLQQIDSTFREVNYHKNTIFGMAGDHGLAPIYHFLNPEVVVLEELEKDLGQKIVVLKISSDEGEGPKLTNNLNPPSNKNIDVVIASTAGGNYMMDFFKDQKEGWKIQPIYKELTKLQLLSGGAPIDIMHEIVSRLDDTLEYLAVREESCSVEKCTTRLIGKDTHSNQRQDELLIRKGNKIFYKSLTQEYPVLLEITKLNNYVTFSSFQIEERDTLYKKCVSDANEDQIGSWCSETDWRHLARFSPRPDSVVQLSHLYDIDLAGTINLFPRAGIGYNTTVTGRHAGEHFFEKDAFVGLWGEPVGGDQKVKSAPIGSLAPSIYQFLTQKNAKKGEQLWGFDSFFNQVSK